MPPDEQSREELAREVELLRRDRAQGLAHNVETDAVAAAKAREDLAAQLAYDRGVEASRINERLLHLDDAVGRINGSIERTGTALIDLRTDMQARFDKQADVAATTKMEGRRLTLQVFSAVLVATISAAGVIIVALISSGPS